MADLFAGAIPLPDQIAEVERELVQRARVYPRMVAQRTLTQNRADLQTARLNAVLASLKTLQASSS